MKDELRRLWENYKIYAESCIEAGVFPAPFGATEEERELKKTIGEDYPHAKEYWTEVTTFLTDKHGLTAEQSEKAIKKFLQALGPTNLMIYHEWPEYTADGLITGEWHKIEGKDLDVTWEESELRWVRCCLEFWLELAKELETKHGLTKEEAANAITNYRKAVGPDNNMIYHGGVEYTAEGIIRGEWHKKND